MSSEDGGPEREVPLEVALSISGGVLLCEFAKLHEVAEFLTGGPIWTHEFGSRPFADMLAADVKRQAPFLAGINVSDIDGTNWRERLAAIKALHPPTVILAPIPDYGRTAGPLETLGAMLEVRPESEAPREQQ